ncbi:MAG: hypothetical protein WC820_02235 [Spirochaetales bacterium]|jgi:hypothetical protein
MSSQEFLALCKRNISPEDCAEVIEAPAYLVGEKSPEALRSGFLSNFVAWERTFRNELARLRARRAEQNEEVFVRPSRRSDEAARAALLCFQVEDPYQAELLLERERWNAIERLSSLSSFDLDFIMAYRMKLAINARLEHFTMESGKEGYRTLYGDIIGRASRTVETDMRGDKA